MNLNLFNILSVGNVIYEICSSWMCLRLCKMCFIVLLVVSYSVWSDLWVHSSSSIERQMGVFSHAYFLLIHLLKRWTSFLCPRHKLIKYVVNSAPLLLHCTIIVLSLFLEIKILHPSLTTSDKIPSQLNSFKTCIYFIRYRSRRTLL